LAPGAAASPGFGPPVRLPASSYSGVMPPAIPVIWLAASWLRSWLVPLSSKEAQLPALSRVKDW
jgi:hypothetical protein